MVHSSSPGFLSLDRENFVSWDLVMHDHKLLRNLNAWWKLLSDKLQHAWAYIVKDQGVQIKCSRRVRPATVFELQLIKERVKWNQELQISKNNPIYKGPAWKLTQIYLPLSSIDKHNTKVSTKAPKEYYREESRRAPALLSCSREAEGLAAVFNLFISISAAWRRHWVWDERGNWHFLELLLGGYDQSKSCWNSISTGSLSILRYDNITQLLSNVPWA